jgi:hypothetical protein
MSFPRSNLALSLFLSLSPLSPHSAPLLQTWQSSSLRPAAACAVTAATAGYECLSCTPVDLCHVPSPLQHASSTLRPCSASMARRDAAVVPNEPSHAPARAAAHGRPSMPRATDTPTLLPHLPWLVLKGPEPLRARQSSPPSADRPLPRIPPLPELSPPSFAPSRAPSRRPEHPRRRHGRRSSIGCRGTPTSAPPRPKSTPKIASSWSTEPPLLVLTLPPAPERHRRPYCYRGELHPVTPDTVQDHLWVAIDVL